MQSKKYRNKKCYLKKKLKIKNDTYFYTGYWYIDTM